VLTSPKLFFLRIELTSFGRLWRARSSDDGTYTRLLTRMHQFLRPVIFESSVACCVRRCAVLSAKAAKTGFALFQTHVHALSCLANSIVLGVVSLSKTFSVLRAHQKPLDCSALRSVYKPLIYSTITCIHHRYRNPEFNPVEGELKIGR
jgi:hypothetical protein